MGLNGVYANCIVRLIEHTMELCRLSQAIERQQLTSPLENGRLRKGGATFWPHVGADYRTRLGPLPEAHPIALASRGSPSILECVGA